jgi:hypothetical protein
MILLHTALFPEQSCETRKAWKRQKLKHRSKNIIETREKDMERAEEERDEIWAWNVLAEAPEEREREMEQEQRINRMREAEVFIAAVMAEVEAAGAVLENG